jgi:class 3 adenylate cyclase/tetratricopeptide (TPR) repeat protein
VLDGLRVDVEPEPGYQPAPLPEDLVRPWLLPAVYERMRTGRGEFLSELRPAIPVFLRFSGIDYDHDDEAVQKLDDFVRAAQRVMNRLGGNVLQLTLGDKGAYLYGVFGSPVAHEDDAARAASAALELRDLERTTAAREIQIGLTRGTLRSGTYGHAMRRTFVCLGDEVNLSARLMSAAPPQGIYASERIRQGAGDAFIWDELPAMKVKGKAEPVAVFALKGSLERASRRRTRFELALVGRRRELAELDARRVEAFAGRGRVIGIAAEAGLGKSRLVAEFVRNVRRAGQTVAFGECQAYGTKTPYFVWREIWRRLFGLEDEDPAARQIESLSRYLAAIDPGLVARAPLLSDVVGLTIPDSDLTRGFDAKLRKSSLEDLLSSALRARARETPFVVVLEDCHWIDELSRDLLGVLVRAASALPVLFVLAYRPAGEPGGDLGIATSPAFSELALDRMEPDDVAQLVRTKLIQLQGSDAEPPEPLVELVATRSEGNPFYVEELLNFIVTQGIDESDTDALEAVRLPDSLQSLVLSRIDAAAERPRRTMKVASVVGRVFTAPTLPGAYADLGSLESVVEDLDALRGLDLLVLDREAEPAWMFKHGVTQEVAYESLPFALRAQLHGLVGEYIERTEAGDLDRLVPLLEHHYWRSNREGKKREYVRRAAERAQASYANSAAIAYYDRLLPLLEGSERVDVAVRLAEVLQLIGDWSRADSLVREALAIARTTGDVRAEGWADVTLAEITRKQGQFEEAAACLDIAASRFEEVGDQAGLGQVTHLAGTVAAQRGNLDEARASYERSLGIREALGDVAKMGALYSNLAIVAEYSGDMPLARQMSERALELRTEAGDRWGIGVSLGNLAAIAVKEGALDEARARSEAAIEVLAEVGDRWMTANAQNNLGNAARDLGDFPAARQAYAESLRTFAEWDDHWALAILLEDIGLLAVRTGDHAGAVELAAAATALREDIGAQHPKALAAELRTQIAPSVTALGRSAAREARRRGRSLGLAGAVALGLRICEAG